MCMKPGFYLTSVANKLVLEKILLLLLLYQAPACTHVTPVFSFNFPEHTFLIIRTKYQHFRAQYLMIT